MRNPYFPTERFGWTMLLNDAIVGFWWGFFTILVEERRLACNFGNKRSSFVISCSKYVFWFQERFLFNSLVNPCHFAKISTKQWNAWTQKIEKEKKGRNTLLYLPVLLKPMKGTYTQGLNSLIISKNHINCIYNNYTIKSA